MLALTRETSGVKNFPKVHWSRTSEHQESTVLVLNNFLLVLNIGLEEMKFV